MSDRPRTRKCRLEVLARTPFVELQGVESAPLCCPHQIGQLLRNGRLLKHSSGISRQFKDRLSRAPTAPFERALTSPSPFLRERYLTALKSQKQTSPGYRPDKAVRGRELREEEIHFIEQALRRRLSESSLGPDASQILPDYDPDTDRPRIQVKASAQSISIIIPKGVKLPVVATIESAGSFELETPMSTSNVREASQSSSATGGDPSPRGRTRRRNTFSEQTTTGTVRASESEEIIAGLGLPFLARVSKGRLNVSEASIPPPQSANISAPGRVFISPHERPPEEVSDPLHNHSKEAEAEARGAPEASELPEEPRESPDFNLPSLADPASPKIEQESTTEKVEPSPAEPTSTSLPTSEDALDLIAESSSKVEDIEPFSIPEIKIHRPSGTVMSASMGPDTLNDASVTPTPTQSAMEQSSTTKPLNAATTPVVGGPVPTTLPVDSATVTNAVPIDAVVSTLPAPVSELPVVGKLGKRKRVVRKARRVIVRKRLLTIILGRDLAKVVHPQLNASGKTVPDVSLSLDGTKDLIRNYGGKKEYRRAVQQRQLHQKIASARIHTEAEELDRCPSCRGLKSTSYLRKYQRLQLQRDRPTTSVIERHVTSRAQVATFQCQCKRRLLGAGKRREARDSALPAALQYLQAPGINEPPLPGVRGDTLP
ncbi:hypothetical protein AYL99_08908 [Fonsecaea erecta]|uniref:Uncharacterized protein n=1 Tax=Fonsecaea erecta TaxID=1367422 RepID=A0A178ZBF1_9EURO|nr:hypothetical protein AYL99_08908 [Fonsecaea erecta]OAP56796.1 hypothetical protein AYL99_08908 [Fonsecaea erecta]